MSGSHGSAAAIQLRNQCQLKTEQSAEVRLRVHPLVLELIGKKTPTTGLESNFSGYYWMAIALIHGAAGEGQYSDQAVRATAVVALRAKVKAMICPAIKPQQVDMTVALEDGHELHKYIQHAINSVEVPMTNKPLEAKF